MASHGVRQSLAAILTLFIIGWLPSPADSGELRVVCYYTNWSVYRPGTAKFNPQNINPYLCTHLVYAFGGFTKDSNFKPFDKYQDIEKGGYAKFTGLKTYNKNLKTMLAVGGWNEGSSRFSPMVANPEKRREFVKNSVKFLRQNHFDGLDLDWEYPAFRDGGKPRDRDNYASLVQELREEYDREAEKTGRPRLLLTMAVPAGIEYINKGYDVAKLMKYLDWMNLLTYDYHSAFEPAVNHHSPLYSLEEESEYNYDSDLNINHTITHYLESGAQRDKLVLGIPTYGRSYTLFNPDASEIGAPADGPGEMGDATRENGYLAYYEICEKVRTDPEWTVVQPNSKAMGPYAYKSNQWVGYDDESIVRRKSEYVAENRLGGIMFWSIDNDDFRGTCGGKPYPLIEAAKESLMSALGYVVDNDIASGKAPKQETVTKKTRKRPSTVSATSKTTEVEVAVTKPTRKRRIRVKAKQTTPEITTTEKFKVNRNKQTTTETKLVSRYTTPEPPTTPDPGGDFKCEDEGFYPHPNDCKKYYWCLSSGPSDLGIVAHQFTCPSGLYFNKAADSCDYTQNVLCKKKTATKSTTTITTSATSTTSTTTTTEPTFSTRRVPPKITAATSRTTFVQTPEPEDEYEYEYVYEDVDDGGSEEDPKVIKELLLLIKKAGGIEELEKQLNIYEGNSTLTASVKGATTPSGFSKSLYERVLGKTSKTKETNSGGQQFRGTTKSQQDDGGKRSRPQYTSILRQRPSTEKSDEAETEVKSGFTPEYKTIRRNRLSSTTELSAEDDYETDFTDSPITESVSSKTPEYVTLRRRRPTGVPAETSSSKYVEVRRKSVSTSLPEEDLTTATSFSVGIIPGEDLSGTEKPAEISSSTISSSTDSSSKVSLANYTHEGNNFDTTSRAKFFYSSINRNPTTETNHDPSVLSPRPKTRFVQTKPFIEDTQTTEASEIKHRPTRRRGLAKFTVNQYESPSYTPQERKYRPEQISDLSSLTSADIHHDYQSQNSRRRGVSRFRPQQQQQQQQIHSTERSQTTTPDVQESQETKTHETVEKVTKINNFFVNRRLTKFTTTTKPVASSKPTLSSFQTKRLQDRKDTDTNGTVPRGRHFLITSIRNQVKLARHNETNGERTERNGTETEDLVSNDDEEAIDISTSSNENFYGDKGTVREQNQSPSIKTNSRISFNYLSRNVRPTLKLQQKDVEKSISNSSDQVVSDTKEIVNQKQTLRGGFILNKGSRFISQRNNESDVIFNTTEQSSTERSSTEQSSTEQSSTEQSSTEQSSTEQNLFNKTESSFNSSTVNLNSEILQTTENDTDDEDLLTRKGRLFSKNSNVKIQNIDISDSQNEKDVKSSSVLNKTTNNNNSVLTEELENYRPRPFTLTRLSEETNRSKILDNDDEKQVNKTTQEHHGIRRKIIRRIRPTHQHETEPTPDVPIVGDNVSVQTTHHIEEESTTQTDQVLDENVSSVEDSETSVKSNPNLTINKYRRFRPTTSSTEIDEEVETSTAKKSNRTELNFGKSKFTNSLRFRQRPKTTTIKDEDITDKPEDATASSVKIRRFRPSRPTSTTLDSSSVTPTTLNRTRTTKPRISFQRSRTIKPEVKSEENEGSLVARKIGRFGQTLNHTDNIKKIIEEVPLVHRLGLSKVNSVKENSTIEESDNSTSEEDLVNSVIVSTNQSLTEDVVNVTTLSNLTEIVELGQNTSSLDVTNIEFEEEVNEADVTTNSTNTLSYVTNETDATSETVRKTTPQIKSEQDDINSISVKFRRFKPKSASSKVSSTLQSEVNVTVEDSSNSVEGKSEDYDYSSKETDEDIKLSESNIREKSSELGPNSLGETTKPRRIIKKIRDGEEGAGKSSQVKSNVLLEEEKPTVNRIRMRKIIRRIKTTTPLTSPVTSTTQSLQITTILPDEDEYTETTISTENHEESSTENDLTSEVGIIEDVTTSTPSTTVKSTTSSYFKGKFSRPAFKLNRNRLSSVETATSPISTTSTQKVFTKIPYYSRFSKLRSKTSSTPAPTSLATTKQVTEVTTEELLFDDETTTQYVESTVDDVTRSSEVSVTETSTQEDVTVSVGSFEPTTETSHDSGTIFTGTEDVSTVDSDTTVTEISTTPKVTEESTSEKQSSTTVAAEKKAILRGFVAHPRFVPKTRNKAAIEDLIKSRTETSSEGSTSRKFTGVPKAERPKFVPRSRTTQKPSTAFAFAPTKSRLKINLFKPRTEATVFKEEQDEGTEYDEEDRNVEEEVAEDEENEYSDTEHENENEYGGREIEQENDADYNEDGNEDENNARVISQSKSNSVEFSKTYNVGARTPKKQTNNPALQNNLEVKKLKNLFNKTRKSNTPVVNSPVFATSKKPQNSSSKVVSKVTELSTVTEAYNLTSGVVEELSSTKTLTTVPENVKTTVTDTTDPSTVKQTSTEPVLHHIFAETEDGKRDTTENSVVSTATTMTSTTAANVSVDGNKKLERLIEVNRIVEVSLKEGKQTHENHLGPVMDRIGEINRVTVIKVVESEDGKQQPAQVITHEVKDGARYGSQISSKPTTLGDPNVSKTSPLHKIPEGKLIRYGSQLEAILPPISSLNYQKVEIFGKSAVNTFSAIKNPFLETATIPLEALFTTTSTSKPSRRPPPPPDPEPDEIFETQNARYVNVKVLRPDGHTESPDEPFIVTSRAHVVEVSPPHDRESKIIKIAPVVISVVPKNS